MARRLGLGAKCGRGRAEAGERRGRMAASRTGHLRRPRPLRERARHPPTPPPKTREGIVFLAIMSLTRSSLLPLLHMICPFLPQNPSNMLYRLVVAALIAMSASVTSAVPAVLDPRGDAPMDARLARLEAKVTALGLHGEDAPDALVKEKTGGKYKSCAHVAAQGLCGDEFAQMGCATTCKAATKVKKELVTAQKGGGDP